MALQPAIALLEFSSIAVGIEAGDAMVKRAPLEATYAGTVQPGRYLVLVGGETAAVEEAVAAGRAVGGSALVDMVLLPDVHPAVVAALGGARSEPGGDALGIVETHTVAAIIEVADAGVKGATVTLAEIRLADGLGGKGYLLFAGSVGDVEAAVETGAARVAAAQVVGKVVIAQLHGEMAENLSAGGRFAPRLGGAGEGG